MNKVAILIAAGIGMIAAAAPASAQDYRHRDSRDYDARYGRDYRAVGGYDFTQRRSELQTRVRQAVRTGRITQGEQYALNTKLRTVAHLEARYRANGMSRRERADLERRLDGIEYYIRTFMNNRHDRY